MLGFDMEQYERDQNADQDLERVETSYLYKIARQLSSIQLQITQKAKADKPKEDVKMESLEEVKKPEVVEKSAFEDSDMEEDGGGREPVEEVSAEGIEVSRTFTDEGGLIDAEIFLHPYIQANLVKMFTKLLA